MYYIAYFFDLQILKRQKSNIINTSRKSEFAQRFFLTVLAFNRYYFKWVLLSTL